MIYTLENSKSSEEQDFPKQRMFLVEGELYGSIVSSKVGLRAYLNKRVDQLLEQMFTSRQLYREELTKMQLVGEPLSAEIGFSLANCLIHKSSQEDLPALTRNVIMFIKDK